MNFLLKTQNKQYMYFSKSLYIPFIIFIFSFLHLNAQLNGTYTIGGAGADYADFTSAVTDLVAEGVNGDVTFNVADGTYNEQITVPTYTGNSNTVTFQSASGDSTAVILTFSANSTDNFTLKFDAAQNVTFKKMTIQATNSSYSRAVEIGAGCTSIQLQNNQIIGIETTQTSDNHAVIYNNGRVDTVNISDNFIQHGSYAMYLQSSSGDESTFVHLSGNDIQGQTNIAMFLMRLDAPFIGKNRLECDANAINLYYHTQTAEISGNTVITGDKKGGISVYGGTSKIFNNMIITEGEGIINYDVTDVSIFYNSVKTSGNYAAIYINAGQTVDLKNNIAYNSTGPAIHLDDMIPVTYSSDYNCLRSDGNVFGIVDNMGGETRYSSLAEYRTGTSTEANSISVTPRFYGQFDLHTSHLALNSQGTVISETSDFDGDSRDGSTPDIGADEFTPADEDVGVYAIYTGASTTCSEVRVSVENSGLHTLNNIPVTAIITTPTTTETLNATIPGPLWSGASTTISMGDISSTETGNFSIKAFTGYPGDNNTVNDTFTVDIVKTSPFTITHVEDFNTTDDKEKWKLNTGYHINPPGGVNYLNYVDGVTTGSMAIMNNSIGPVTEESYLIFDFKNDLPTSANSNINIYILGYECNERVDTLYTINGSIFQVSDYETYQAPIGDNAGKYLRLAVEVSKGSSEQLSFHIDDITIANAPLIDLGEDKNSCTGETMTLDAGAGTGYTYSWHELSDPGTELGTNQTLDVSTNGDYVAIVTEPDYSLSNSDTVNVIFDDTPTANDQTPEICDNEATGVDLTELDNAITGGNGLDVTWYTDAGLTSPVADPSSTNVNDGDVFYARVGTGSCTATATVTYTVKTSPTVTFSAVPDVAENDPAFDLTQGSPAGGTYSGTGITTSPEFDPSLAGDGMHTITYTYTDANECSNSETQTITVVDGPVQVIQKNSRQHEFIMHPNPVSDVVKISVSEASDLTIFNPTGEKKVCMQIDEQITINCSGMAPGTYIVVVNNHKGIFTKKLVIK